MTSIIDTLNYIDFAQIGRPHGLKGAFFLKTPDKRKIWDGYKVVVVESANGFVEKKVTKHYLSGDALVLELEGINSRTEVESLYNKKLFVHKNQIKLGKDEYLVHDLMNFSVVNKDKGLLGKIVGVVSYGAQENLEISLKECGNIVLYPFVDKYILNIDQEKKEIEVEYLEEFLA